MSELYTDLHSKGITDTEIARIENTPTDYTSKNVSDNWPLKIISVGSALPDITMNIPDSSYPPEKPFEPYLREPTWVGPVVEPELHEARDESAAHKKAWDTRGRERADKFPDYIGSSLKNSKRLLKLSKRDAQAMEMITDLHDGLTDAERQDAYADSFNTLHDKRLEKIFAEQEVDIEDSIEVALDTMLDGTEELGFKFAFEDNISRREAMKAGRWSMHGDTVVTWDKKVTSANRSIVNKQLDALPRNTRETIEHITLLEGDSLTDETYNGYYNSGEAIFYHGANKGRGEWDFKNLVVHEFGHAMYESMSEDAQDRWQLSADTESGGDGIWGISKYAGEVQEEGTEERTQEIVNEEIFVELRRVKQTNPKRYQQMKTGKGWKGDDLTDIVKKFERACKNC